MFSLSRRGTKTGAAQAGWVIDPRQEATFIWEAPRQLSRPEARSQHAKSISACPAINEHEGRLTEVPCPIDIRLRFGRNQAGEPTMAAVDGEASSIRPQHLSKLLMPVHPSEWRDPAKPILQVMTPYIFVADEPIHMSMLPAFYHHPAQPLPGLMIGGRMPIHIWPRPLVWAFEWHDTARELTIKRGDPWFYLLFETENPARRTRLVEAEMTEGLREYTNGISGVTNYVSRTYGLFDTARQRRPKNLLTPKKR